MCFTVCVNISTAPPSLSWVDGPACQEQSLAVMCPTSRGSINSCRPRHAEGKWFCLVIAPSLIPKQASDRVKTDRRDACHLVSLGSCRPIDVLSTMTISAGRAHILCHSGAFVLPSMGRYSVSPFCVVINGKVCSRWPRIPRGEPETQQQYTDP